VKLFRTLAALAFVAAFGCMVPGGGSAQEPSAPTVLKLQTTGDPHTLLPILITTTDESYLTSLVFDTLVDYDDANRVRPDLAAQVPSRANGGISADGKTIVMQLRRGVHWHDGTDFTAADVLFTIHAILDEKNNVANRSFFTNIASMDAPDSYTVRFRLKAPQASFLATVGYTYPVLPEHLLAKSANLATDPFNGSPVGTGPYKFVRWNRGDRLEYAANPDYFGGKPKIGRIAVMVIPNSSTVAIELRQHAVDFSTVDSASYSQLRSVPGLVHKTERLNDFVAYAMNAKRPLMSDKRVRLAIVRAVDRVTITRKVTFGTGTPAYGDLPLFMYDGRPPAGWSDADPTAAGALLDAAGWKRGPDGVREKNGVRLHLQILDFSGTATGASVAVQVQQMLRRVGIESSYKTFAPSLYYSPASAGGPLEGGNYDMASFAFVNGVDPSDRELYACESRIPAGFNSANYCSPEMERLQADAEREYDPVRRNRIVAAIEALAVRDATYLFLYHTPYRIGMNPALQRPSPAGLTNLWYGIPGWTFAKQP
jgi:peptide/nickel transport system substrate-binding protein